ncbi:RidA family protein [Lachnospiraceae bacterium MD308]|nr:RidA family protein [Lachnospiraceae bacterium MD308]
MNKISTDKAPAAIGPYSQAIEHGGMIYVSGQLPIDPATGKFAEGGTKELTRQSMNNISAILEAAGSGMNKVVKTTIFVQDLGEFGAINEAYAEFFGETAPARACVQAAALPKGAQLEIEAIAYK